MFTNLRNRQQNVFEGVTDPPSLYFSFTKINNFIFSNFAASSYSTGYKVGRIVAQYCGQGYIWKHQCERYNEHTNTAINLQDNFLLKHHQIIIGNDSNGDRDNRD